MTEDQRIYHQRIVADPRVLAGKPVIKGTRIGVDLVLEELSHNPDITELLAAHPDLTRTDVQACLSYAKDVEFHYLSWMMYEAVYQNTVRPVNGWVTVPDTPGLGLEPKPGIIQEYREATS